MKSLIGLEAISIIITVTITAVSITIVLEPCPLQLWLNLLKIRDQELWLQIEVGCDTLWGWLMHEWVAVWFVFLRLSLWISRQKKDINCAQNSKCKTSFSEASVCGMGLWWHSTLGWCKYPKILMTNQQPKTAYIETYDLVIIGGGINGTGIARDAAGRGLKERCCEQHDLLATYLIGLL